MCLHRPLECNKRRKDGDPGQGSKDGDCRNKVVEDLESICGEGMTMSILTEICKQMAERSLLTFRSAQVGQSHKASGKDECNIWDTSLGAPGKDLGGVSVSCKTVQGS